MKKENIKKIRKKIVKKRKNLRLRKIIIGRTVLVGSAVAFLGLLGFGVFKALDTVFEVKNIYADGNLYYDSEALTEASGIKNGDNLLFLNASSCENSICSKLPYVDSAHITKIMPNKIKIEAQVSKPQYDIFFDNSHFFISQSGKFLEKKETDIPEVPSVIGVNFSISEEGYVIYEKPEIKEIINIVITSFEKRGLSGFTKIDLSDLNNISLCYGERVTVLIGSVKDIDYKMLTANEVIKNKIKPDEIGNLDVSKISENNRSYFTPEVKKEN